MLLLLVLFRKGRFGLFPHLQGCCFNSSISTRNIVKEDGKFAFCCMQILEADTQSFIDRMTRQADRRESYFLPQGCSALPHLLRLPSLPMALLAFLWVMLPFLMLLMLQAVPMPFVLLVAPLMRRRLLVGLPSLVLLLTDLPPYFLFLLLLKLLRRSGRRHRAKVPDAVKMAFLCCCSCCC